MAYEMPEGPGAPFLARFKATDESSNEKSAMMSSEGKADTGVRYVVLQRI